jgi:hypothetical protein
MRRGGPRIVRRGHSRVGRCSDDRSRAFTFRHGPAVNIARRGVVEETRTLRGVGLRSIDMKRPLVLALAAAAALFGASAAQAARVNWSVGIDVPSVGAVIQPAYAGYQTYAAPVFYAPRPILYAPRPQLWLPPLPPLPLLPFFGPDRWHHDGHDQRDGRRDHDDRGDHDRRAGWRR